MVFSELFCMAAAAALLWSLICKENVVHSASRMSSPELTSYWPFMPSKVGDPAVSAPARETLYDILLR